jgi:Lon protease-like protein
MHDEMLNDGFTDASEGMLNVPDVIGIFPLPRTVLLPGEILPLHVFEPRYRQLVESAIAGPRVFGVVEVEPGHEHEQLGSPPVRQVGCLGFVAQHQELSDGRYVLWLVGLERFHIDEELEVETPFRQVRVTYTPAEDTTAATARMRPVRRELRQLLPGLLPSDARLRAALREQIDEVTDTQLVALASQILELPSDRKQALLEAASVSDRFLMLYEDLYAHLDQNPELDELDPSKLN